MNSSLKGHASIIFTIIMWGMTFVSTKILLSDFSSVEILFNRFLLAYLASFLIVPKFRKIVSVKDELVLLLAAFFGVDLYFIFENAALFYSYASNVSVLVSTAPLFTALGNRFFGDKSPLTFHFLTGFVVAITGTFFLCCSSFELKLNPLGDAMAICSAISWAGYTMCIRYLYNKGYKSAPMTKGMLFYAVVLCLPIMLFTGYEVKLPLLLEPVNLFNFVFLAVICSTVCFITWNLSVKLLGAIKTSVYLYAQPVITAIGAVFILNERPTVFTLMGIILITCGLVIPQNYHISLLHRLKQVR